MPPKIAPKDKSSKEQEKSSKPKNEASSTSSTTAQFQLRVQVAFHVSKESEPPSLSFRTVSDW